MAGREATTGHACTGAQQRLRRTLARGLSGLLGALVLALGQFAVGGGVLPASAHDNCQNVGSDKAQSNGSPYYCGYTQIDPYKNWPYDNQTAPWCSTCIWWDMPGGQPGNVPAAIHMNNVSGVNFHDDALSAMYGWGGQPYKSPWMYECTRCSASQIQVTVDADHFGNWCGMAKIVSWDGANRVLSAWAKYNLDKTYWDGPARQSGGCNAQQIMYHEIGHVFALGHSSDPSDVMYFNGNNVTSVTAQAQAGLNAIYGPCCGDDGCTQCQVTCQLSAPDSCGPLMRWLDKAWQLSQGTPAPNPVSIITPSVCDPATLHVWLPCMIAWEESQIRT
jgi:Matrixin